MEFVLDKRIELASFHVLDLALCQVRLMDDERFPWLLLLPRRANAEEWTDLTRQEQHLLTDEISAAVSSLQELFEPVKVNVASLGNHVRQLHVHIIARSDTDPAWPDAVWCHGETRQYDDESRRRRISALHSWF